MYLHYLIFTYLWTLRFSVQVLVQTSLPLKMCGTLLSVKHHTGDLGLDSLSHVSRIGWHSTSQTTAMSVLLLQALNVIDGEGDITL